MPQFDFYSFSTQVYYILLVFAFFHFFILNFLIVSYGQILKLRQKLFNIYLPKKLTENQDSTQPYAFVTILIFLCFF